MVIDNEITKDKYEIGKFWEEELNKETAEYKTFDKTESGQYIFSYLLLLEQSLKRKRKLSRILSEDLNLQPRTREDIDALFLSVSTQEARSLKPALDYNYYEGMKVFLANDWKGDSQFLKNDKDLEDVISIDIPFMLPLPLPSDLNTLNNKTRNFAIGYDAFEIALLMEGSRNLNKTAYKGLTGKITFKDNTIKRNSIIFKIKNGKYEYLN
jgi:Putative lipoprotein